MKRRDRDTIQIPLTVERAVDELTAIDELLTAKQWARAAIVAAFVDPGAGQGRRTSGTSTGGLMSASAFAELGIKGLTTHNTVLQYANAWLERFARPKFGEQVVLPLEDWPPTRQGSDGYNSEEGLVRTIDRMVDTHGATAVGTAVGRNPAVTNAAINAAFGPATRPAPPFAEPPVSPLGQSGDDFVTLSGMLGRIAGGIDIAKQWVVDHPRCGQGEYRAKLEEFWLPQIAVKLEQLRQLIALDEITDADLAELLGGE